MIAKVADECGLSRHATGKVMESVLNVLSTALASEGGIRLEGFGTFSAAQRPAPGTAQMPSAAPFRLPAGQAIRFQSGPLLTATQRDGH